MRLQTTATIPAIGTAGRVACPLAFAAIVALSLLASPVGAATSIWSGCWATVSRPRAAVRCTWIR